MDPNNRMNTRAMLEVLHKYGSEYASTIFVIFNCRLTSRHTYWTFIVFVERGRVCAVY